MPEPLLSTLEALALEQIGGACSIGAAPGMLGGSSFPSSEERPLSSPACQAVLGLGGGVPNLVLKEAGIAEVVFAVFAGGCGTAGLLLLLSTSDSGWPSDKLADMSPAESGAGCWRKLLSFRSLASCLFVSTTPATR